MQTQWHIQNQPVGVLCHSGVARIVFNLHSCSVLLLVVDGFALMARGHQCQGVNSEV